MVASGEGQLGLRRLPRHPGTHLGGLPVGLAEARRASPRRVHVAVEQRGERRGHLQAVGVGHRVHPHQQRPRDLGVVRRPGGGPRSPSPAGSARRAARRAGTAAAARWRAPARRRRAAASTSPTFSATIAAHMQQRAGERGLAAARRRPRRAASRCSAGSSATCTVCAIRPHAPVGRSPWTSRSRRPPRSTPGIQLRWTISTPAASCAAPVQPGGHLPARQQLRRRRRRSRRPVAGRR